MMYRLTMIVALMSFWLIWQNTVNAEEEGKDGESKIFISGDRKAVKGFPVIVKIRARGPLLAPKITLFDETAEIRVTIASKTDKRRYFIKSTKGMDMTMMTRNGERIDTGRRMFQIFVPDKEERTMLSDISSLRSELGNSTIFMDIYPGEYSVSVEFPSAGEKSNSIEVEIREPLKEDKEFLKKILSVGMIRMGDYGVNWSRFLKNAMRIPASELNGISKTAQRQIKFHLLLSDVLSSESMLRDIPTETLEMISVPDYLEPEKKSLLLEIDILSGKSATKKIKSELRDQNPDLLWRLQDIISSGWNFIRYKRGTQYKRGTKWRRP